MSTTNHDLPELAASNSTDTDHADKRRARRTHRGITIVTCSPKDRSKLRDLLGRMPISDEGLVTYLIRFTSLRGTAAAFISWAYNDADYKQLAHNMDREVHAVMKTIACTVQTGVLDAESHDVTAGDATLL